MIVIELGVVFHPLHTPNNLCFFMAHVDPIKIGEWVQLGLLFRNQPATYDVRYVILYIS